MTNIIKVLDNKTVAITMYGKTKILTKRVSTLDLRSWYNIKGDIYA
jgi:hypothetical protein